MRRRWALGAGALVVVGLASGRAAASPDTEASDAIGTRLAQARSLEAEGKIASAERAYLEAAEAARSPGDPREEQARARAADLVARVPTLTVKRARGADAKVSIWVDGVKLEEARVGFAMPVDPGVHTVRAEAAGHIAYQVSTVVTPRDRVVLQIPRLTIEPKVERDSPRTVRSHSHFSAKDRGELALYTGALSAFYLFSGAGCAYASSYYENRASALCEGDVCTAGGRHFADEAQGFAVASGVSFAVGGVGTVGTVLIVALP